jgi:hypothetical protein
MRVCDEHGMGWVGEGRLTENYLRRISLHSPIVLLRVRTDFGGSICQAAMVYILESARGRGGGACAHLFRVVDLPDEGLPTRPMSGSRGMLDDVKERKTGY